MPRTWIAEPRSEADVVLVPSPAHQSSKAGGPHEGSGGVWQGAPSQNG
jgi:hypothetical protein